MRQINPTDICLVFKHIDLFKCAIYQCTSLKFHKETFSISRQCWIDVTIQKKAISIYLLRNNEIQNFVYICHWSHITLCKENGINSKINKILCEKKCYTDYFITMKINIEKKPVQTKEPIEHQSTYKYRASL